MSKKKDLPTSKLRRSFQLLSMASAVASKELAQTMKDKLTQSFESKAEQLNLGRLQSRIEQAKLIAENLSRMKGAAMKAGQLLSLDAADYFPPEALEILSKLQAQAEAVPFEVITQVIREELGEEKLARLSDIEPVALAAASIGQVHRAQLGSDAVALKVQYPGVRESIDADLKILKQLAETVVRVSGRQIDLSDVFEELRTVLKAEADYLSELKHLDQFRTNLAGQEDYVVPRSFAEFTSTRVLTMTWEPGLSVLDWIKTGPSQQERNRLGELILNLYCQEFFEWGLVQTDPNYANFKIQPRPLRLVVLDFGATLSYSADFRKRYMALLQAIGSDRREQIEAALAEMYILDPRESAETRELFFQLLINSAEPFHPQRQPFEFSDRDYARQSRELGQRFTASLKYSPPPRDILFLHRKLGGIFTLLKRLEAKIDLMPYWDRMVGSPFRR